MNKQTKSIYPHKTSINLVMKETEGTDTRLTVGLFAAFLLVLVVFTKFAVIDKLQEAYKAEAAYHDVENQIQQMKDYNGDYDKVREEYSHYSNGYLNDAEKAELDRMKVLDLVQTAIMEKASVQSLVISGNNVTLTLNETTLNTVSQIVTTLEADERTSYVTVSTAGTNQADSSMVTANMVIQLANGGSVQ